MLIDWRHRQPTGTNLKVYSIDIPRKTLSLSLCLSLAIYIYIQGIKRLILHCSIHDTYTTAQCTQFKFTKRISLVTNARYKNYQMHSPKMIERKSLLPDAEQKSIG
jgi:hypothetical protein